MKTIAWLAGVGTVLAAGIYMIVSLNRWEWNRALMSAAIFIAAEVAVMGSVLAQRLKAISQRLDAQVAAAGAPATAVRRERIHAARPPARGSFARLARRGLAALGRDRRGLHVRRSVERRRRVRVLGRPNLVTQTRHRRIARWGHVHLHLVLQRRGRVRVVVRHLVRRQHRPVRHVAQARRAAGPRAGPGTPAGCRRAAGSGIGGPPSIESA